jgi:hypothetical protein
MAETLRGLWGASTIPRDTRVSISVDHRILEVLFFRQLLLAQIGKFIHLLGPLLDWLGRDRVLMLMVLILGLVENVLEGGLVGSD